MDRAFLPADIYYFRALKLGLLPLCPFSKPFGHVSVKRRLPCDIFMSKQLYTSTEVSLHLPSMIAEPLELVFPLVLTLPNYRNVLVVFTETVR